METGTLLALLFLSTFVEGLIKYILDVFSATMTKKKLDRLKKFTQFGALALGIVLAIAYKIDLLALLFGFTGDFALVSYVVSGVVIGRGSNYLNDVISKVRQPN